MLRVKEHKPWVVDECVKLLDQWKQNKLQVVESNQMTGSVNFQEKDRKYLKDKMSLKQTKNYGCVGRQMDLRSVGNIIKIEGFSSIILSRETRNTVSKRTVQHY